MKKVKDSLSDTIADLRKRFGDESVVMLDDKPDVPLLCSTGSIGLDWAIGIGGYPRGRIVELYGLESTGKTTLALLGIATAQAKGLNCAFLDLEHALDPQHAIRLGVDTSRLLMPQTNSGEEAMQLVEAMASSGNIDLIVVDSVAAIVPKTELSGLIGDVHIGKVARLMGQTMRVVNPILEKNGTTVLFLNQIRQNAVSFGNADPNYTPGGKALKFYCSVRIEMKHFQRLKKAEEVVGNTVRVRVTKNKVGDPMRQIELNVMYGTGVSRESELLYLGELYGLVSGNSFGDIKLGRGHDSSVNFLIKELEVAKQLEEAIRHELAA